jgi:hypothetical protein
MTNPDGTYRIEGVPPRNYVVYVHPLPPALQGETYPANIVPPQDVDRRSLTAASPFETQFFPGTKDPQSAFPLTIGPGSTTDNVNFSSAAWALFRCTRYPPLVIRQMSRSSRLT